MLTIFLIVMAIIAAIITYPFIAKATLLASMDKDCRDFALDMLDLKNTGKMGNRWKEHSEQLKSHDASEKKERNGQTGRELK